VDVGFDVDPDSLRTFGGSIEHIGVEATGDLGRSHGETETGGYAPWGTSFVTNSVISALYQELTSLTGEALDLVVGGVEHSGSGVRRMADAYERTDDTADEYFRRTGDGLRGPL
jgi:hypothetical protein